MAAVAARSTAPGGGASAALVTALAAALTAMAARFADDSPGVTRAAETAERLRAHATGLADADVAAYTRFVQARRQHGRDSVEAGEALDGAIGVPMQVTRAAAEIAALARSLADDGNPRLRGDAATGCWLAAAAASAGAVLVAENLAGSPGDPRIAAARELAEDARTAATGLRG
jgi:formiminotetrahydrofolate cyclodeaminase